MLVLEVHLREESGMIINNRGIIIKQKRDDINTQGGALRSERRATQQPHVKEKEQHKST